MLTSRGRLSRCLQHTRLRLYEPNRSSATAFPHTTFPNPLNHGAARPRPCHVIVRLFSRDLGATGAALRLANTKKTILAGQSQTLRNHGQATASRETKDEKPGDSVDPTVEAKQLETYASKLVEKYKASYAKIDRRLFKLEHSRSKLAQETGHDDGRVANARFIRTSYLQKADATAVEEAQLPEAPSKTVEKVQQSKALSEDLLSDIFDELVPLDKIPEQRPPRTERHVPQLPLDTDLSAPHRPLPETDEDMSHNESTPLPEDHESATLDDDPLFDVDEIETTLPSGTAMEVFEDEKESVSREDEKGLGLLILRSASKLLTERDFKCLLPMGKHIEGWPTQGTILNIIRGRDRNTLARNGTYYLVFDNEATAKAYLQRAHTIHEFARRHFQRTDLSSPLPLQPNAFQDSHPGRMLHAYALSPPSLPVLDLKLRRQPWPPLLRKVLDDSGYAVLVEGRRSKHEVLLSVEGVLLHPQTVRRCIVRDGKARRVYWATVGDPYAVRSFDLNSRAAAAAAAGEERSEGEDVWPDRFGPASEDVFIHRRFVASFASRAEATRFVLAWHGRDIKELIDGFDGEKAVVNAELTW